MSGEIPRKAGLREGDVVEAVNGRRHLLRAEIISEVRASTEVTLSVCRCTNETLPDSSKRAEGPAPRRRWDAVDSGFCGTCCIVLFAIVGTGLPAFIALGVIVVFMGVRFVIGLRQWGRQ